MTHIRWWAYDSETTLSTIINPVPELVCGSFYDGAGEPELYKQKETLDRLEGLLRDPSVGIVGHNIAFDLRVVLKQRPGYWKLIKLAYEQGRVRDTMVREKLVAIKQGRLKYYPKFSLDYIAQRRLGIKPMDKGTGSWRLRYGELIAVPLDEWPERAAKYAKDDAKITFRVFYDQQGGNMVSPCEDLQTRVSFALHDIEKMGNCIDRDWVEKYGEALQVESDFLGDILVKHGILRTNKSALSANQKSVRELIEFGYKSKGLEAPRGDVTESMAAKGIERGNIKTDIATILALEETIDIPKGLSYIDATKHRIKHIQNSPLQAFVRYKNIQNKLISTYLSHMNKDIVRPRFNVLVETGRMSCSKPNLQNLPREPGIRECVKPRKPGHLICSVDYSGLELRTLGQSLYSLFGVSSLRDLYVGDVNADPHAAMASKLWLDGATYNGKNKQHKSMRQLAKAFNFGVPGGLGAKNLASFAKAGYGIDMTPDEAKAGKDDYFKVYPEMRTFFKYIGDATQGETFEDKIRADFTLPVSGRVRGNCGFTDGANYFFQGPGSDVTKAAVWEVYCASKDPNSCLFKLPIINVIHDEIIMEVPEGEAGSACAREIERLMVEAGQPYNPDVPLAAEPALCDIWRKNMEYRVDDKGMLLSDAPATDWRHGWDVDQLKKELGYQPKKMRLAPLANTLFGDIRPTSRFNEK